MTNSQYLILNIDDHNFAAKVSNIEDVIQLSKTTPVPLSKDTIGGLLNLRGHIVTEIDVSKTLGIDTEVKDGYAVVITTPQDEFYSLSFEGIGDVIEIGFSDIEPLPETVQKSWHSVSKGVYRNDDQLIVILDLDMFIDHLIDDEDSENLEGQFA